MFLYKLKVCLSPYDGHVHDSMNMHDNNDDIERVEQPDVNHLEVRRLEQKNKSRKCHEKN